MRGRLTWVVADNLTNASEVASVGAIAVFLVVRVESPGGMGIESIRQKAGSALGNDRAVDASLAAGPVQGLLKPLLTDFLLRNAPGLVLRAVAGENAALTREIHIVDGVHVVAEDAIIALRGCARAQILVEQLVDVDHQRRLGLERGAGLVVRALGQVAIVLRGVHCRRADLIGVARVRPARLRDHDVHGAEVQGLHGVVARIDQSVEEAGVHEVGVGVGHLSGGLEQSVLQIHGLEIRLICVVGVHIEHQVGAGQRQELQHGHEHGHERSVECGLRRRKRRGQNVGAVRRGDSNLRVQPIGDERVVDPHHCAHEAGGERSEAGQHLTADGDGGDVHGPGIRDHIVRQPFGGGGVGPAYLGELAVRNANYHLNLRPCKRFQHILIRVVDSDVLHSIRLQQLHHRRRYRDIGPLGAINHSQSGICFDQKTRRRIRQRSSHTNTSTYAHHTRFSRRRGP